MLKSPCIFLCLCYFVIGSYGSGNLVPFIDKCEWSDKACLKASTAKAIGPFCKGLPELGIEPMDPLKLAKVTLKEGGLIVKFTNIEVTGMNKCKVLNVERDVKKHTIKIEAECPFDIVGHYDSTGTLLTAPIEGNGPFHVNCKSIYVAVEVVAKPEVKDGVKYWKIGKATHTYEARKQAKFNFENLFNGDKDKAQPVLAILNEFWKQIAETVAKPLVDEVIDKCVQNFQTFCTKVPADQLEK